MMRLIVDTNQADPIRFAHKKLERRAYPTLVVPYLVWTELLEGPEAEKRRRALQKFPLLFGMVVGEVFEELTKLSEDKIRKFVPVYPNGGAVHKRIASTFLHPTPEQVRVANEVKAVSREHRAKMLKDLPQLHKKHKTQEMTAKSRGETPEQIDLRTIEDGEQVLFLNEDGLYRKWLIEQISTDSNGDPRPIVAASDNSLFEAAWDNPMIRRFLKLLALVSLGYAQRVWEKPELNRLPRMNSDDVPDMTLVLYARDGDTILTGDNVIKERIRHVDIENKVGVSTWDEWLTAQIADAR